MQFKRAKPDRRRKNGDGGADHSAQVSQHAYLEITRHMKKDIVKPHNSFTLTNE